MKIMTPIPRLSAMWPCAGELAEPVVRGFGAINLAGGAGVLLPMLLHVEPQVTIPARVALGSMAECAARAVTS